MRSVAVRSGLSASLAGALAIAVVGVVGTAQAEPAGSPARTGQPVTIYEKHPYLTREQGIEHPAGVAYIDGLKAFAVAESQGDATEVLLLDPERERSVGRMTVQGLRDPGSLADDGHGTLAAVDAQTFYTWPASARGDTAARTRSILGTTIEDPRGMTYDPANRRWLVLDAADNRVVGLDARGPRVTASVVSTLTAFQDASLSGLALDPAGDQLYVSDQDASRIYAVTREGETAAVYDTSDVEVASLTSLTFGESADPTDPATETSLYATDAGDRSTFGRVAELSLAAMGEGAAVAALTSSATLVRETALSALSPPSPDTSGIAYMSDLDRLIIADSEVDEVAIFAGTNIWQLPRSGASVLDTGNTLKFSQEPTGIAYDADGRRVFVSDDNKKRVFEITTGPDNRFGTADDPVSYFSTTAYGNTDPEDVTYDSSSGDLFVSDGVAREVYRVSPGPNGRFDGVAPAGDDTVSNFDVSGYGSIDLEGIGYSPTRDSLFLADRKFTQVLEVSKTGALIQSIDIRSIRMKYPAAIALAPATDDPTRTDLYVVTRGIDNDKHPDENDGMLYELSAPNLDPVGQPENAAPVVDAGQDLTITLPSSAVLDGSVSDDGLPNPPGFTSTTWTKVSGPGTVTFGDPGAVDTTAAFSSAGAYVLRLSATDSALTISDDVNVVVNEQSEVNAAPIVSAGSDQSITLPASASLGGLVSDDGLPNPPGATSVQWSKVSGPGAVTFSDPTSTQTTASFTEAGTYVLRLTADDSELSVADEVTVDVAPPPAAGNLVKNAGFEVDTSGWKGSGGGTLTRVDSPHTGAWAGRLVNTDTTSSTCQLNDSPNWVSTSLPATYTATAWVRGDAASAGSTVRLRFREYVDQDRVGTEEAQVTLSTSWQQIVLQYTPVAPGSSTLDLNVIRASTPAGAQCFLVDDITATTD